MKATKNLAALAATITAEGRLVGPNTSAALELLGAPEVRQAFEVAAFEFHEAILDSDETAMEIVDLAHRVRVAVAQRWAAAGASTRERELAARVDRALDPYRDALHMVGADVPWLVSLRDQGVEVDSRAWWGSQIDADQRELAPQRSFDPPGKNRHQLAWDRWFLEHHVPFYYGDVGELTLEGPLYRSHEEEQKAVEVEELEYSWSYNALHQYGWSSVDGREAELYEWVESLRPDPWRSWD